MQGTLSVLDSVLKLLGVWGFHACCPCPRVRPMGAGWETHPEGVMRLARGQSGLPSAVSEVAVCRWGLLAGDQTELYGGLRPCPQAPGLHLYHGVPKDVWGGQRKRCKQGGRR